MKEKTGPSASGTAQRYESAVDSFISFLPATRRALPLGALTVGVIQSFRDQLRAGEGGLPAP